MKIVLPRILVSASLISLALLLVSATPIHPFSNALGIQGLETAPEPQAPSVSITEPLNDVPARFWEVTSAMIRWTSNEGDMVKTLTDAAEIIKKLPIYADDVVVVASNPPTDGKTMNFLVARKVFFAIAKVKPIVSTFKSRKKDAIKGIEACEEAALQVSTRTRSEPLQRPPDLTKTTTEVATLMNALKAGPQATSSNRYEQSRKLTDLVYAISLLSLKEQGEMGKELRDGYEAVEKKITAWELDHWRENAMKGLEEWNGLNSLVGPQSNKSN